MKILSSLFLLILGVFVGMAAVKYLVPEWIETETAMQPQAQDTQAKKPLYWVAPMDPNFKSDQPGKSPMGMDLIPVYADEKAGADEGPGTIRISPDVINNIGVRLTRVTLKPLHSSIKTVGYVQYDEDRLIHIHPRVEGWVENLYVKASGDPVKRGQALYTLYSPTLVNAQEEYLIALQRKNARLIRAAEARLKALQLSGRFIKNLRQTRQVRQKVTFYAPQSGVIAMLNIREGYYVKPGTTMMSIGVLDEVWVQAEIFERQATWVKVGLPVTMTLAYVPGREWLGQVDYIYPTLDPATRTLRVRLRFNNQDQVLMPDMFTRIRIHADSAEKVLTLPKEAVIRTGNMNRVVLALGEGRFKSVAVKTGRADDTDIEILAGVKEGEQVVASAQFLIDSESSKTSDFRRLDHEGDIEQDVVWTQATVNSVMPAHRMINVSHQPVRLWQWPAMTMDFTVADTVDMAVFEPGSQLEIQIEKTADNRYLVTDAKQSGNVADDAMMAEADGIINSIMPEHRMLNVSRGPVPKWNRGAATMDFIVDKQIDISQLKKGMKIHFRFVVDNGTFTITQIERKEAK